MREPDRAQRQLQKVQRGPAREASQRLVDRRGFFLTPIFYPERIIPEAYRWWLFNLNPMCHFIKLFRMALISGVWPSAAHLAVTAGIAVADGRGMLGALHRQSR